MKKIIKIITLCVISILLLVEISLRIFYYEQLKTRYINQYRKPDSLLVFNKTPNVYETIISPGINNTFRINNHGFVGPDFDTNKNPDVFRIVIIGSSLTFGMYMNSTNTFSVYLQKALDRNHIRAEVINCGREGSKSDIQSLNAIKYQIINFQPDLILLEKSGRFEQKHYVFEDYKNYMLSYDPGDPSQRKLCIERIENLNSKYRVLTFLYDISYIVRAGCKKYLDRNNLSDVKELMERNNNFEIYLYTYIFKKSRTYCPESYYRWSYIQNELSSISSLLKEINCKLVLFYYTDYPKEIKNFYKETNIDLLELGMQDFDLLPLNSKLEGHYNETGNALIGSRLFSELLINELIPNEYYSGD